MKVSDPFREYLRVQRRFDLRIMRILEAAAKALSARIAQLDTSTRFSDTVRRAQLRAVLAEVRAEQIRMWRSIGDEIQAGRLAGADAAQEALDEIGRVAYAALPQRAAEDLIATLRHTARAGIDAAYARIPRALSSRVYDNALLASGKIDQIIMSSLAQGLSAKEFARDVYGYISPTTPGGASYAAMRLARTEINNAFHQQQIEAAEAPGVKAIKWNLSGSHPRPDECNIFAAQDAYDMGGGVYPINQVPDKPHPHCLCYLTYISMDPVEFVRELRSGTFDQELRRRYQMNLDEIAGLKSVSGATTALVSRPRNVVRVRQQAKPTATKPNPPVTIE